jgi:hypothetical protein
MTRQNQAKQHLEKAQDLANNRKIDAAEVHYGSELIIRKRPLKHVSNWQPPP